MVTPMRYPFSMDSSTPVGRDAVSDALIASAARLFAERGLDDVSVRQIAADAGVNHALVFRHFGSKAGLLRAVLAHHRRRFAVAAEEGRPRSEIRADQEAYTVILARVLLDGSTEALDDEADRPIAAWLRAQAATADLSPERTSQLIATVLALELGWRLFQPVIGATADLDQASAEDLIDDCTLTVIDALLERWHG